MTNPLEQPDIAMRVIRLTINELQKIRSTTPLSTTTHKHLKQSIICLYQAVEAHERNMPRPVTDRAVTKSPDATLPPRGTDASEIILTASSEDYGRRITPTEIVAAITTLKSETDKPLWVVTREGKAREITGEVYVHTVRAASGGLIAFHRIEGVGVHRDH